MSEKFLKNLFDKVSKKNDFLKFNNYWYKQTNETITILSVHKSKFGNYLDLNIKIFIQGLFDKKYELSKELFRDTGDIFRRHPIAYNHIFNLDIEFENELIVKELEDFFEKFINPFSESMLSKEGIIQFYKHNPSEIFILTSVKKELGL